MQLLIVNTDAKPAPRLSANRPENAKGLRPKGFQELIYARLQIDCTPAEVEPFLKHAGRLTIR